MTTTTHDELFGFLESIGTSGVSHTGRPFISHLKGTMRLLLTWGSDLDCQRAGLFHSIYGTNAFKKICVSFSKRDQIVALIGKKAEHLAYLFCTIDRPQALLDACKSGTVTDRNSGHTVAIPKHVLRQLIEIECANLLEQGSGARYLNAIGDACRAAGISLREPIVKAICTKRLHKPADVLPQIQIMRAELGDVSTLLTFCRQAHVDSRYAWVRFDAGAGRVQLASALNNSAECVLVAKNSNGIVGGLHGRLEKLPFTAAHAVVCEYFCVAPRTLGFVGLKLFTALKAWARASGAVELKVIDSFGMSPDRTGRYLECIGMTATGGSYSLWL